MTKVVIVDVNLAASPEQLIKDDVLKMDPATEQALTEVITDRRRVETLRRQKVAKFDWAAWFQKFVDKPEGFTKPELADGGITNVGSFVANFKSYLRNHQGNTHALTKDGEHYKLVTATG